MKVDRLVSIIMILLDKERIGAQELADMFEVSLRTIYRDIDTINMAGIPVRGASGVGGGFEIMQKYKIDRKFFSTTDLSAILMGLSSLSNMIRGDELVNALAKVKSFIPAERTKEIELEANQIYVDLSPWMGSRNIGPSEMAPTKSNDRVLPITDVTLPYFVRHFELLERQKELVKSSGAEYYENNLFIPRPDGSPYRRDRVSTNFGQLLRHLEMPHIRFHDLRHTAATNMHQFTGDFFTVGEILGHTLKGIGITLGISGNLDAVTKQYVEVRVDRNFLLYNTEAEFRSLSYEIYPKAAKKFPFLSGQSEMVYLFIKDYHRVRSMFPSYAEFCICESVDEWIKETYQKHGVNIYNFCEEWIRTFSESPDNWPRTHKKKSQHYDEYIKQDARISKSMLWDYDYKQKSNLFNLDTLYRNMPKKSFTRNRKQHFETLLLYCWLHYWENDEDYWNEYMDVVSPSL